jgi:hypothetical protein
MESSSSSLFYNFQEYFSSSDDNFEAFTNAVQLAIEFYLHEADPPRPIIRRTQVKRRVAIGSNNGDVEEDDED